MGRTERNEPTSVVPAACRKQGLNYNDSLPFQH